MRFQNGGLSKKQLQYHDENGFPVSAKTWNEDMTQVDRFMVLQASTYRASPLFDTRPCPQKEVREGSFELSPERNWCYRNLILPAGTALAVHGEDLDGKVVWDGDVVIPALSEMHVGNNGVSFSKKVDEERRICEGRIWMSLTPSERISLRRGIQMARGKVVVGGLGLGWFLRKISLKAEVEEIIVVERSKELLDWFGYELCRDCPNVSNVICDDVYRHLGRHGGQTMHLLDIWAEQEDVARDMRFQIAQRRFGRRIWGWGSERVVL